MVGNMGKVFEIDWEPTFGENILLYFMMARFFFKENLKAISFHNIFFLIARISSDPRIL